MRFIVNEHHQFVVFRLDEQRYALPLSVAERIVRAAEVTPLPRAPAIVLGVIDVAGRILPVVNTRRRFLKSEREISPSDQFLIARTLRRTVILVIDEAQGVVERLPNEIVSVASIIPGSNQIQGVIKLDDGLVLIHDLDEFLSMDEANALNEAMKPEVALGT